MTAAQLTYIFTGSSGNSPLTPTATPPMPSTALAIISMGFNNATSAVTSIVVATAGATGTFVRANSAQYAAGAKTSELWLGYNFTGFPTQFTITWTGGSSVMVKITFINVDADLTVAPTITAGTPVTGSSVTCDSGTVTPAVGDILIAQGVWAVGGASTARTSTGNTFIYPYENQAVATMVASAYALGNAAALSRLQWTIPSAAWIGLIATITFAAPTPVTGYVYKGRDTALADAGLVA